MKTDDHEIVALTLGERPERIAEVRQLDDDTWPEFIEHSDIRKWNAVLTSMPRSSSRCSRMRL
jgi:hypothetical protein